MITHFLFRHRQSFAIVMLSIFVSDMIGAGVVQAASLRRFKNVVVEKSYRDYLNGAENMHRLSGLPAEITNDDVSKNIATPPIREKLAGRQKTNIGGPGQPEMQAFQSVGANNLVDLFTGDFSYNIPLLDVGGYPVGLSYKGGATMDEEASWVGLGWNINPGTITRNVRGLPDDFNGKDSITKVQNTRPNWTAGVNVGFDAEIFSASLKKAIKLDPSIGIYYNNYTGPGFQASINPGVDAGTKTKGEYTYGVGDVKLNVSFDSKSGFNINPTYSASIKKKEGSFEQGLFSTIGLNFNSRTGLQDLQLSTKSKLTKDIEKSKRQRSVERSIFSSTISFSSPTFIPTISMPQTHLSFTLRIKGGGEAFGWHPLGDLVGSYSQSYIAAGDRTQVMPAYGYLHSSKAVYDQKALLDFNREKDIPYRKSTPTIAVPFQTYDVFSISGEGVGGSFRAYRGDAGFVRDHKMRTKSISANLGLDIGGAPNIADFGVDPNFTNSFTENKKWSENNLIQNNLSFKESDTTYEAVYFRNPGEQSSNSTAYYNSIGGDDLVRVKLTGDDYSPTASNVLARFDKYNRQTSLVVNKPIVKTNRDKRSQVISYLNAYEASLVGMEKDIHSYYVNQFPLGSCDSTKYEKILRNDSIIRKPHHISEITVLNADGRSYVYGIPAYNLDQQDITFSVNQSDAQVSKGLVGYSGDDLSTANNKGKDSYYSNQRTPAHAHSYLLTALKSSDYVDITGNGISDDDQGDAVKFNYSRLKWAPKFIWSDSSYGYTWRTPTTSYMANYDEGLRTDKSDDKGHVMFGEKEIWFLNSIESKTMLATFVLDTALRKDAFAVQGIHGGRSSHKTRRLKEINLYSKADLKKYGTAAKAIKTVHFSYSYRLCKGYPDLQDTATGKLTLEAIWFTYNGTKKGKNNRYVFNYGNNPVYQYKSYDRWGNYKPASDNPAAVPTDEFPYALKDSTKAGKNAAAWALSEIILPSSAKMQITYESDDYAYVQNKRANEMFQVEGFGTDPSYSNNNTLYQNVTSDRRYVFIKATAKVANKKEVFDKYLAGQSKIYFRLHIKMPGDSYGAGYEYLSVYADYKNYDRVNDSIFWLELQPSPEGPHKSPLATAALQFLRLNLPSKAYPGSDVGNEPLLRAAVMSVLSIVGSASQLLFGGFNNDARIRQKSKEAMLNRTFVRLSSPVYKKYGGGYRVKKITIRDNWQQMVGKKESLYGQEYNYTTTKTIAGTRQVISSGVASYEPSLGNDENPFHQPVEYTEKATLAPSNFLYVEEPFAESLFPSAGVGYSKVRVSSINRKNIKSATGFEETSFYTAYDFPTITQRSSFDGDSQKQGIDKFTLFNPRIRKFINLSQGFKIELNDMHGKMKSSAVYAESDTTQLLTYTAQYYRAEPINGESFRLLNTVPVIDSANGKINMNGQIGKDIELITDMREQYSETQSAGLNFDVSAFLMFIAPITLPSFFPEYSVSRSRYRAVSMLKVIQRYGIIDSVVHIDKGSKVSTRNLAWDGETGEVLLTQTQNEFNDPVYQFNYPAHWAYSGAGLAYKNIDAVFKNVEVRNGRVAAINGIVGGNEVINRICESGDEIIVLNKASGFPFDFCPGLEAGSTERRIWVVDRGRTINGTKDLYLVERNGKPYIGNGVNLRIIRSGRRNMASAAVGSIVSLRSPIKTVNDTVRIVIDSTIEVVSAGAAVMKDAWPVEDRFYKLTVCDSSSGTKDTTIYTSQTGLAMLREQNPDEYSIASYPDTVVMGSNKFIASRYTDTAYHVPSFGHIGNKYQTRGLVQFNLGFIPANAIIDSAKLKLYAVAPQGIWAPDYWDTVTKAHTTAINQSELLRITHPWNASTKFYRTDTIVTETNKAVLLSSSSKCQNYTVNVKNMVQDMVQEPDSSYGMLLRLSKSSPWSSFMQSVSDTVKVNHMSFCIEPSILTRSSDSLPPEGCDGCTEMALDISYHYNNDTCSTDCRTIFTQNVNPYVQGIWGNWRGWRSYVYYDNRKQTSPDSLTNIRTDGVIDKFRPYWALSSTGITPAIDTSIWVWNSEITRYNRRGLETENHDPLGRFNSGLYGYNNTLPVAVTQNARHRETAFDGFEDYDFTTDNCTLECPLLRHLDFSGYKDSISTTQKHSGKSSLRMGAGSVASVGLAVKLGNDSLSPSIVMTKKPAGGVCERLDKIKATSGAVYPGFTPLPGKLMMLSAWAREDKDCKCLNYTGNEIELVFYTTGSSIGSVTLHPAGNIIEGWQRYEDSVRVPATADSMAVRLRNTTSVRVYFDDLRMYPYNANMKSFVYHPSNLRLLAELDENNYASFYEYDDEGTLIRVKKETERGIKTITETRTALRKTED